MALRASYLRKVFRFNFEARTSRGLMENKVSWFVKLWNESEPEKFGIGECGPLPGLSIDAIPEIEDHLEKIVNAINSQKKESLVEEIGVLVPPHFPSLTFAFETAAYDLVNGGKRLIFNNDFRNGKPIPINGLIWMGSFEFMIQQVHEKIKKGFSCIKLKVGGIDFEKECALLAQIRRLYKDSITIRLDANGAFKTHEALARLERLSQYNIHSIEQPIKQGQSEMEDLCRNSPIPIALDEELIGCDTHDRRVELLTTLRPEFIILKPTLHGGFSGCKDWIHVAESKGIGWWITSALESNIGLNAICQFTANYPIKIPHGLATRAIYENNISSPLTVRSGEIYHEPSKGWSLDLWASGKISRDVNGPTFLDR